MRIPLLATFLVLSTSLQACADVRLSRLFGDNMVLQQQTKNAIWGWADAGEVVSVSASWGAAATATADEDRRWKLFLETPAQGTGHSLSVVGQNRIQIRNVAVGEVWLCAGQSNMGWSTGNSFEAEKEADVDRPNFRIFKSQREHWHEPLEQSRDRLQRWKPCNPESAAETSAVSYYFGKTLHQHLDVPVGVIVQAYAGTPIEGWMPWEIQRDDVRAVEHKDALDVNAERRIARGETVELALATFQEQLVAYNAKIDAGETMKNAFRPLQPPFITKPASLGHQYPAHIFNAMIHPIRPYGIRGMIWYQGERNSKNVPQAAHYHDQLTRLVSYYRSSWHEFSDGNVSAEFPFQFTQLPSWNPAQTKPVEGLEACWAVNRESMRQVEREVPATGMVVSIDTGDAIALHPKNKKPIGIRHALLALQQTYRKDIVGRGPCYRRHQMVDEKVILEFDSVGSGLKAARPKPLNAFAVAGNDGKWHWADAAIDGSTVVVSTEGVPDPVAVRYAWAMNPSERNLLYNKEGLPASPFRTDSWPLFAPEDDIVEVNKPEKPDGYQSVDWQRPVMTQAIEGTRPFIESNGLAPEVTDLNAEDVSYALEHKLPYLARPFIDTSPEDRSDGIPVGELGRDGGDKDRILKYARELASLSFDPKVGNTDSLLISYRGRLVFESYFRRGRINYPHYQMSITKSYTAMAVGRAIQLGHLSMEDLDKPVVSFLNDLKLNDLVEGADQITLHEAMHMASGIRLAPEKVDILRKTPERLKGQGQIQAYLQHSEPISAAPRDFKYQASDPAIAMQVLEAVVSGSAADFIRDELLGRMGIRNYQWQTDVSGLPKSAAGASVRSRDMLKIGLLVLNDGKWQGKQLIPADFVNRATSPIRKTYGKSSYGYFWWTEDYEIAGRTYHCKQGRGAGGQYIFMFPEIDLIAVVTAHNRGMGDMLRTLPQRVVPAFVSSN